MYIGKGVLYTLTVSPHAVSVSVSLCLVKSGLYELQYGSIAWFGS